MRLPLIVLAAAALAAPAAAQTAAAPAAPVDLSVAKRQLKNLVTAQEVYFVDHNSYSPDLIALRLDAVDSVTVRFVEVKQGAWAATATMKGQPNVSCVVFVGAVSSIPATAQGRQAKAEGGVMCDGDSGL